VRIVAALMLAFLVACSTTERKGGYYKDDGPGEKIPSNLDSIADATPRAEPLHKWANRPYQAMGKGYTPLTSVQPFKQRGLASWYGKKFHGQKTSSGELYDMYKMTAAHPTLPIPSYVRVTRVSTGKSVVVRVNDRGPFHSNRIIDLSYVAAYKLGYVQSGSAEVTIEAIVPGQARAEAR
jgi:rare lipoprotein A